MDFGERLADTKFLLRDRDSRFTASFDAVFSAIGIRSLKSPPAAPRANAICERIIGTLRRELLDRTLVVNERHLTRILEKLFKHLLLVSEEHFLLVSEVTEERDAANLRALRDLGHRDIGEPALR